MNTQAKVKTILVIDDDPAVLQSYGRLLGRLGHQVILVSECDRVQRDPGLLRSADLLIVDQRMPGATGLDLVAALRRRQPWIGCAGGGPTVLLVSGFLSEELRLRAARLGVTGVIEKPVNPHLLLQMVRDALADAHPDGAPPSAHS
jgi:two-component system, LuxR family, response regulator FixJ